MVHQIAKTCHAIHIAYCNEIGIPTQPDWDKVEETHKKVMEDSIQKILDGHLTCPRHSHNNFVFGKIKEGWKFGEQYDKEKKLNPRLTKFEDLSEQDRVKESLFFSCVRSFM